MKNFILSIFVALILFGIGAFVGVRLEEPRPNYTPQDSISRDSLTRQLDTIFIVKPKIEYRVKYLREVDTVEYIGTDTTCLKVIENKTKLIAGLDSLVEVLDLEARTYSDLVLIEQRRNTTLSLKMDSTIALYSDSLKIERKTAKKKLFWSKVGTTIAATIGIYAILSK